MDSLSKLHIKNCFVLGKSYFIWILLHYTCSHLYVKFCTPKTPIGFIISPFLAITPQCKACYWLLDSSRVSITNMWGVFTLWVITKCTNNI